MFIVKIKLIMSMFGDVRARTVVQFRYGYWFASLQPSPKSFVLLLLMVCALAGSSASCAIEMSENDRYTRFHIRIENWIIKLLASPPCVCLWRFWHHFICKCIYAHCVRGMCMCKRCVICVNGAVNLSTRCRNVCAPAHTHTTHPILSSYRYTPISCNWCRTNMKFERIFFHWNSLHCVSVWFLFLLLWIHLPEW